MNLFYRIFEKLGNLYFDDNSDDLIYDGIHAEYQSNGDIKCDCGHKYKTEMGWQKHVRSQHESRVS